MPAMKVYRMLSSLNYLMLCFSHVLAQEVALESSLPFEGAQACPGKAVSFTCEVTNGTFLTWIVLPYVTEASFFKTDEPEANLLPPEAGRFLLSTSPFRSTLVLQSTENVTNTTVTCATDNNVRQSLLYRKAEIPLPPSNITMNTPRTVSNGLFVVEVQWKAPDDDIFYVYKIHVFVVNRPELYNGEKLINNATSDVVTFSVSDFASSPTFELRIDIFTIDNCNQPSHTNESKIFPVHVPNSRGNDSKTNIAAAISVPIVILITVTVIFTVIVIIILYQLKMKELFREYREQIYINAHVAEAGKQKHIGSLEKKIKDLKKVLDKKDYLIELLKEKLRSELDHNHDEAKKQIESLEEERKDLDDLFKMTNYMLTIEKQKKDIQNEMGTSGEQQEQLLQKTPESSLSSFEPTQQSVKDLYRENSELRKNFDLVKKQRDWYVKKVEALEKNQSGGAMNYPALAEPGTPYLEDTSIDSEVTKIDD